MISRTGDGMGCGAPASIRTIIGSQYFLYFGVLGAYLPFFNLYCYHIGLSGFQIGALSALRSAALVLFALLWGVLADRHAARRPIYIGCSFAATGVWMFYLMTERFVPMLVITLFYGMFFSPVISFLEAFAMDALGGHKRFYGRIRAWGSISFIAMVVALGRVIDTEDIRVILVVILVGSLFQAALSFRLPHVTPPVRHGGGERGASFIFRWPVLAFLCCAFLMLVSHGAYYGFFSIHLESLGFDATFIGLTWAVASAAEIAVMLTSGWTFNRYSPQRVLLLSFMAAAVRWFLLFLVRSPAGILATQLLHAVTYGAFHMASILYIDTLAPEEAKTTGQAVNNAVTYGLGLMTGFFLNGWLYERLGSAPLFLVSAAIALAGGLLFITGLSSRNGRSG
jgi:PPP family 3-phenylpropionic acid transporter